MLPGFGGPTSGSSVCTSCDIFYYNSQYNRTSCDPCPLNSKGGTNATALGQCLCSYGYFQLGTPNTSLTAVTYPTADYALPDTPANESFVCTPCPAGAVCSGDDMPQPLKGYWRTRTDQTVFYPCFNENWCLAGTSNGGHYPNCAAHHSGILCGQCEPGPEAGTRDGT